jgi:AraC family L-rhamnose operon transcriptional activator RhaR
MRKNYAKIDFFVWSEHTGCMDIEHSPVLYCWKDIFTQANPLVANRHVLTGDFERHTHDFMELALVVSGSGKHLSSYGDEPLLPGQAFVLHPGTWHAYHDCRELVIYNCCFQPTMLQHELLWKSGDITVQRLLCSHIPRHGEATFHRLRLIHEQVIICQGHLENIIALEQQRHIFMLQLLGHFLLFLATFVEPLKETVHPQKSMLLHPAIQQSMILLEENLAHPWTLTTLAQQVGLAPSYLSRLFHAQIGETPITYLSRRRVEYAVTLVEQTNLSIREIGLRVGWPDSNHFARKFRTLMGISATRYRTLCHNGNGQQDQTHTT